ncbi:MAG: glycosyltransferase family 39 protein, partial [Deltaproteobacteria bacterium]|nr:glycosyltransferase family 39 protein [Deltaproteobacteria bacterium]
MLSEQLDFKKTAIASAFLLIFIVVSASIATKKNNTWDEPAHILAGYAYLKHGSDFLSPRNHPVAGRGILSFPLLFLDLDFDRTVSPEDVTGSDFHPYAVRFLYENKASADTILFLARLMNILLGALLGAYVFVWARELWGDWGAYLSLFLFVLSPDVLAHSSLATTDMPVTAFFFIASYYLYRMAAVGPDWKRTLLAALFV